MNSRELYKGLVRILGIRKLRQIPKISVTFNALDIVLSAPHNINYRDDGYVEDVDKHMKELDSKYGTTKFDFSIFGLPSQKESIENEGGIIAGACQSYGVQGEDGQDNKHNICYLKISEPDTDISLRAHEEVHAIERMGLLEKLAEHIKNDDGVIIDFSSLPHEVKQDIGSIYALRKKGINPDNHIRNTLFPDFKEPSENYRESAFQTAWDIYRHQL